MPTWGELEGHFRELAPTLRFYRLDYQWGAAGTYYRLAGGAQIPQLVRFEELATQAGAKLGELPAGHVDEIALQPRDLAERWYEALKAHSGMIEYGHYGVQRDADGGNPGVIYTASIGPFVEASAILSLRYAGIPDTQPIVIQTRLVKLNSWLKVQRDKHGMLWLVFFALLTLIVSLIAL